MGGLLSLQGPGPFVATRPLLVLSPRQFAALAAAADAVAPDPVGRPSAAEVQVAEQLDLLFASFPAAVQSEMKQLLSLLESPIAGLLLGRGLRPFSELDRSARRAALRGWRTSRISLLRSGAKALVGFASGTYWTTPAGLVSLGYPGPQPWVLAAREALIAAEQP